MPADLSRPSPPAQGSWQGLLQPVGLASLTTGAFPCRIIKADFPRPAELSADCFSLLDAMLNVDTELRITVQGIMQHPWFLTNLPEGMLQLNKRLLQSPANPLESGHFCKQNEDQIQEVCEAALAPPETTP